MSRAPVDEEEQEWWRSRLMATHPTIAKMRAFFRRFPAPPRCEWCAAPFSGPFVPLFRMAGFRRFPSNPKTCTGCFRDIAKHTGGVELPCTALFADVRGSTPLAQRVGPRELHDVMDRFYREGFAALTDRGALVDRFLGDEVVGYFVPGFAGADHARAAVDSALALLRATGNAPGQEPWVPVGAGIHTGTAFVGNLGAGSELRILTALGEDVNIAARLAAQAGPGEVLVSEVTFMAAGLAGDPERRVLELKGISRPVAARVLSAA